MTAFLGIRSDCGGVGRSYRQESVKKDLNNCFRSGTTRPRMASIYPAQYGQCERLLASEKEWKTYFPGETLSITFSGRTLREVQG